MIHYARPAFACALVTAVIAAFPASLQAAERPAPPRIRWEKKLLIKDPNEGIAIADVNRDGKLDIIAGTAWYAAPDWKSHPIRDLTPMGTNNEFYGNNGDHAIDLNGDGWVDVLTATWFDDKSLWFENPGKEGLERGDKWKMHIATRGHGECEGTLLEDLDDDGVPELLIDRWHAHHPMTVYKIELGKNGSAPKFTRHDIGSHNGHGAAIGDVNGDGRKDVVTIHGWYEAPEGDRWADKWKHHKAFDLHHLALPFIVTDLTGDGKNDLIIGQGHDYGLFWLEQGPVENGEITWTRHEIDKSFSQSHCLAWADLDGDGKKELVTGKRWRPHADADPGAHEPVCLFRYIWDPATRTFTRDTISFDEGVGTGMQIRFADLDEDGRLDIAVAGKSGTWILFNRGPAPAAQAAK